MEADDDIGDPSSDGSEVVDGYEQLRAAGAVRRRRRVAAGAGGAGSTVGSPPGCGSGQQRAGPGAGRAAPGRTPPDAGSADELVGLLASMALAVRRGGERR